MTDYAQRKLIQLLKDLGFHNELLLQAIYEVPRSLFVEEAFAHRCAENIALPIGENQTLSQPYIVAKMTELLSITPDDRVLEIGTGSGYQTAILAKLAKEVYSVERIKKLQWSAMYRLRSLELHNISLRHSDGWQGWQAQAPFDAIIVTAAASEVPHDLLLQLAEGGRMIIPVGEEQQVLKLIYREGDRFKVSNIENVKFVPLVAGDLR